MVASSNKRKGPDPVLKLLSWLNATAAISLFFALFFTAAAKPESKNFFDHFFQIDPYRRSVWNKDLLYLVAVLLGTSTLSSITGLIVNQNRLRRKGDYVRSSLVVCLVLSVLGMGFCLSVL